jgi:hypothetical protein
MKAKFKIGDENYEFKEITLKKYYELRELLNNPIKGSEYQLVELMTDCPVSVLKKLKMNEWLIVWDEAIYRITQINGNTESIQPWIEFNNVKYALPAVEEMTIGEFVDLDVITSKGDDKYLAEIAAIVYRPVIKEYKGKLYVEDYDADKSAHSVKEYSGVFNAERGTEEDGPKRPGGIPKFSTARTWWRIINTIAGEDPLRFSDATRLPVRSALNWLSWRKDQVKQETMALQKTNKIR